MINFLKCVSSVIYRGKFIKELTQSDDKYLVNAHSTAKLIQVLPIFMLDIHKKYNLTEKEIAIMSSSHIGQDIHIDLIKSLIDKLKIKEDSIQIEKSSPVGKTAYENWLLDGLDKSKIYHPCVGNHIALMTIERELSGKEENYLYEDSKSQKLINEIAVEIYELKKEELMCVKDNCGSFTYITPLNNIAIAYRNLGGSSKFSKDINEAIKNNYKAIKSDPTIIEGDGCISTILTRHNGLLAKTGAEGLLAINIKDLECGIAIKSVDGDFKKIALVIKSILTYLGFYDDILDFVLEDYVLSF